MCACATISHRYCVVAYNKRVPHCEVMFKFVLWAVVGVTKACGRYSKLANHERMSAGPEKSRDCEGEYYL